MTCWIDWPARTVRIGWKFLGVALAAGCLASSALAQTFPVRPVKLLVGFAPGGGSDIVARLVAKPLGDRLGQPVVVENRPGAGGNLAADAVAKAAPDGHVLALIPSGHASNAAIKKTLPFDPIKDFTWIGTITTYPLVLAVKPDSPITSFADFLQRTRTSPDRFSYTSVGVGTAMHLVGEWLMSESGGAALHVPFKGGTGPLTELLAGRVDVMIDTMTSTAPLLREKRLRALAVTAPRGSTNAFGVPAVADTLPNVVFESWLGLAAPAGTPPAVVARLNNELRAVLALPEVHQKLVEWGGSPSAGTPQEFQDRVARDIDRLRRVVADRRIERE